MQYFQLQFRNRTMKKRIFLSRKKYEQIQGQYQTGITRMLLECKKTNEKGIEDTSILHLSREIDETPHEATNSILESPFFLKNNIYSEDDYGTN